MVAEQISALQENGIGYIEVRGVDEQNITALSLQQAKELAAQLERANIRVWSIGSPIGKIKITDDFAPDLKLLEHTAQIAQILGCDKIRMFSFYMPDNDPNACETYRDEVFSRISAYLETANKYGVTLCHENEKSIYGDTLERCLVLHRAFPQLKAVFDPANFAQCGENPLQAFHALTPYLSYIHIKDVDSAGQIVPPGEGVCDIAGIVSAYAAAGGSVMTLEPHLMEFCGLSALENGEKSAVTNLYQSTRDAFDDAAKHLKEIVRKTVSAE